ncbi:kinesin-like protein KIN-7K, chloroplastic isoform X3 [Phaseolus vulgaris]|uniref:kinesin-like protein KIN-7K, chloroplastic isoform X3 n=1 Tax=Phaseolus vulgaris TaxID=3885 RepID=UPI0035CC2C2F
MESHVKHALGVNVMGRTRSRGHLTQGTFVEGIKEEVVLSPAHALSLIAAGEEHRHVGSTNFNLLSSRSHTIFSLTVESSPCGENSEGEAVTLSQLNLIDLAGSESSRAETTGLRRREGSYINKSLLTLGTVISKLTECRASHIPYRDSKLTRLLQSSLSGHGRISLICTVTPSSSNAEETHNTLKFAHRAKHIEIQAAQNTIIDEKSLIKKYQHEIQHLKEELEQMKRGIVSIQPKETGEVDFVLLKQKLEDGQVKLQSRLEEEEEAKAALLGRIQRLTKLILVSTKPAHSTRFSNRPGPRRRHSFGEEELAYLPHKRRDLISDDENTDLHANLEGNVDTADDSYKEEKKTKKHGLLNWLKMRKRDTGLSAFSGTSDKSCGTKSVSTPSTPLAESGNHAESRHSHSLPAQSSPSTDFVSATREDKEIREDSLLGQETPLISIKSIDEIDLLREQQKILSEEVSLHSSTLKRLSLEAARNPQMDQIHVEMERLKDEIKAKKEQINFLQKQIADSFIASNKLDESGNLAELLTQLNEKSFELEVKTADNHIIQEQLHQKIRECESLQETVCSLKQQLADALELSNLRPILDHSQHFSVTKDYHDESYLEKESAMMTNSDEKILLQQQANEIEELKHKLAELTESEEQLELRNQKLAEESSYAKGLASAAAVELKALSEEVAKLMNQNERLLNEQAVLKNSPAQRRSSGTGTVRNGRRESHVRRNDQGGLNSDIKRELALSKERELSYESALLDRDHKEVELQRTIEESKQREAYLENELANMWVLVAKLKKSQGAETDV